MQEGQLKIIMQAAKNKVIRMTKGRKSRARVYDKTSRNYRLMRNDMPILRFMYAVPLDTINNPFEKTAFPTLQETQGKVTPELKEAEQAEKALEARVPARRSRRNKAKAEEASSEDTAKTES